MQGSYGYIGFARDTTAPEKLIMMMYGVVQRCELSVFNFLARANLEAILTTLSEAA